MDKLRGRKIVIVNQAVNYLTVGFCNAFADKIEEVSLITGSIHIQGEQLDDQVKVDWINKWKERPSWRKFASYLLACLRIFWLLKTRYRKHEVFFVSIPPMGYLLNLLLANRFSMVIWDIYPDTLKITGMKESHMLYKVWSDLNKKSFAKAFRLFTIGERMADLLARYVSRNKIIVQPIWSIFQRNERIPKSENPFVKQQQLENKFVVQYSGNIGLTHKVELMIDLAVELRDHPDILFQIIGRGPRKPVLEKLVKEQNLPNCTFLPFQSDEMFPYSLSAADLGVVILDDLTAKGSVPSKSYNLMSYGIPSLYIASEDSELKLYTERFQHGACFPETQLSEAAKFILKIKEDPFLWQHLSDNAMAGSEEFRRDNADKFVDKYLNETAPV